MARFVLKGLLAFIFSFSMCSSLGGSADGPRKPRLILQITVDQLRGDLPRRHLAQMGPGGFRYLLSNGAVYENAHHAHANTETIVGHVTLATGANPSQHGMVGNVWFDAESDRLVYNIEDASYDATGGVGARDMDSEVDRSQVSRTEGRSPRTILTTTFGDELSLTFAGKAKVFAVSGKDRGAVSMAGHVGKAFWYSTQGGGFTSSTYYYEEFPDWVRAWNAEEKASAYSGTNWELSRDPATYLFGTHDDRPYENPADLGFGRVFPHPYGDKAGKYYYTLLLASPVVDELTVDFAKVLIQEEGLGQDAVPDYLAISLSGTDYVGHLFGPSSLETEENLLRLDRTLAALLEFIDQVVGLESTLVVLSADHGTPEAPEYMAAKGISAGRINLNTLDYSDLDSKLQKRFGVGKEVIKSTFHPYVYLDRSLIETMNLDLAEVSGFIARELVRFDGIGYAIPSTDLAVGRVPDAPIVRQVLANFNPTRSGEIYIIYGPHWCATGEGDPAVVNHGSPWRYDSYVPVIFAGAGVKPQHIYREIATVDLATTLSAFVGTNRPSGARGRILREVVK